MLSRWAYYSLAGLDVVSIFGVLAFLLMALVMLIPFLRQKGYSIKFGWHMNLAWGIMLMAVIHLILALSIRFGW